VREEDVPSRFHDASLTTSQAAVLRFKFPPTSTHSSSAQPSACSVQSTPPPLNTSDAALQSRSFAPVQSPGLPKQFVGGLGRPTWLAAMSQQQQQGARRFSSLLCFFHRPPAIKERKKKFQQKLKSVIDAVKEGLRDGSETLAVLLTSDRADDPTEALDNVGKFM
jgi:hypothetical protein